MSNRKSITKHLLVRSSAGFLALLVLLCQSPRVALAVPLSFHGVTVRFADKKRGAEMIGTADAWVKAFGPMDRQMRLREKYLSISEREFLEFAAGEVRGWDDKEITAMTAAVASADKKLTDLNLSLSLPGVIWLIQTTGAEEADAGGYTRGNAIIVPEKQTARSPQEIEMFFLHELFHIMTRHDPDIRAPLYRIIGFNKCEEIDYPKELIPRKITNPDAFHFDTYIELFAGGEDIIAVPVTLARPDGYDGGKIFANMMIKFLELDRETRQPVYRDGQPVLHDIMSVNGFFEKVGHNTNYIVHPEEIMAVNFSLAVTGQTGAPNPEIFEALLDVLTNKAAGGK